MQPAGISRDSPWTHVSWMQALDLNFPLLSDWNADAVHAFGVAHDFRGFKDVAERTAFLVDRERYGPRGMAVRGGRGAGLRRAALGRPGLVALLVALYLGAGLLAMAPQLSHAGSRFLARGTPVPGEAAAGDHLQAEYHLWLVGHQLSNGRRAVARPVHLPAREPAALELRRLAVRASPSGRSTRCSGTCARGTCSCC